MSFVSLGAKLSSNEGLKSDKGGAEGTGLSMDVDDFKLDLSLSIFFVGSTWICCGRISVYIY